MGQRVAPRGEPTLVQMVETLRQADVVHADETGWYVVSADSKAWLWVFASPEPKLTLYLIRLSRGIEVPLEVLGPEFIGTLGVDGIGVNHDRRCRGGARGRPRRHEAACGRRWCGPGARG